MMTVSVDSREIPEITIKENMYKYIDLATIKI